MRLCLSHFRLMPLVPSTLSAPNKGYGVNNLVGSGDTIVDSAVGTVHSFWRYKLPDNYMTDDLG